MTDPFDGCLAPGCQAAPLGERETFCSPHWRELMADEVQALLFTADKPRAHFAVLLEIRTRLMALQCRAARALARGVGFLILHCVRPVGHAGEHDYAAV